MSSIVTVTVPAASFNLTTLPMVKTELGITDSGPNWWLDRKIERISAAISTYCDRIFAKQTYSEALRFGYSGADYLSLSEKPIVSITSINESGTDLTGSDYEIDNRTGVVYRLRSDIRACWSGSNSSTIVYVAGYELPGSTSRNLPFDIEEAALILMKGAYQAKGKDPALKSIDIPGVISEQFWIASPGDESGAFPPDVCSLLDPYRRIAL